MRWLRRLLWLCGAVLLLWAVAWIGVPPLLKWQAELRLSEALGRTVTVGKVDFRPWSLRLAATDIAVAAAPGAPSAEPQLRIGALDVDVDARSLLHFAPVVESLRIEAPRARLTRTAAGHYDIDDLIARFAPKPDARPGEPPRFALYNLELRDGEFVFDDKPEGRAHRLSGLHLTLPFVSNLAADVEVKVEPRLAFSLDGAAFDSAAQALPFAPDRNGSLALKVSALDLAPYLDYQPAALPVRVARGKLNIDLGIDFAAPEHAAPRVALHGAIKGDGLAVTAADGAALAEADALSLTLADVQPLARKAIFDALRIDGLVAHVARSANGEIDVARLAQPEAPAAVASAPAASSAASAPAASAAAANGDWQIGLASLAIAGGRVIVNDAAVQPAQAFVVADLAVDARQLQFPPQAAAPFTLKAVLRPQDKLDATLATLSLDGQASASAAGVDVDLASVSLAALAPYVGLAANAKMAGTAALRARIDWAAPAGDKPQQLVAKVAELGVDHLAAGVARKSGAGHDIVAIEHAKLTGAEVDLTAAKIDVAAIEVRQPDLRLERGADGAINVLALAAPTPLAQVSRAGARAAASLAWRTALHDVRIDGGRVRWDDAAAAPQARDGDAVRLDLDRLRVAVRDVRLDGARLVSQPQVALSARVGAPAEGDAHAPPGTLDWRGTVGVEPLLVRGALHAKRLPVHAVQAYAQSGLGLRLQHADAGFDGNVFVRQSGAKGFDVDADGDVLLSDVMLMSIPVSADEHLSQTDRELLSWQSFDVKRFKIVLRPDAVPKIAIGNATLTDFFARLVLTEDGRLNLRDVTERSDAAAVATPGAASASAPAPTPAASSPAPQASRLPIELDLGGLDLVGGRVDYTDHFIKPNFSAALTELDGRIGAFRTGSGEPATLQIAGRVAGTGRLEIAGRVAPGALPRELDITAKATDIELAPLSPYARKYAGYAIERGRLSVDVHYQVATDGKLQASQQLILNQLTFGEHVDSPDATKLPVLLAVSLLQDANGVIDINLPVSGSLSDPQFSLGGVIWKVIVNLLTKAITAPFTLLAGGGGHDMSVVAFEPGTSVPTPAGAQTIAQVAKALADRPALEITITGEADPQAERDALRRALLDERLAHEQQREAARASGKAPEPGAAAPAIDAAERARLVKAVYKATDLPGKPRNLIGMQADIPTEKMEAMLLEQTNAGADAMRELALNRAVVVRDALAAKGLSTERVFLGASKMHGDAATSDERGAGAAARSEAPAASAGAQAGAAPADGAWTPRAKLDLKIK